LRGKGSGEEEVFPSQADLGVWRSVIAPSAAKTKTIFVHFLSEKPPLVNYQMLLNSYLSDVKMNTG